MNKTNVTLRDIYQAINDFRDEVREGYVTKAEFDPVRAISYGLVGLIMMGVVGAILATVIRAAF